MRTLGYEALKVNLADAAVPGLTETAVCYAPCAYTQATPPASHSLPGGGGTGGDPSSKVVKTIVGCGEAGELALNALTSLAGAFAADGDSGSARGIAIAMGAGAEEEEARSAAVTLPPTEEQRRSVLAHVSAVLQALLRLCRMGGDAKATAHYKAAYTAVLRGQGVKSLGALLEELLLATRPRGELRRRGLCPALGIAQDCYRRVQHRSIGGACLEDESS